MRTTGVLGQSIIWGIIEQYLRGVLDNVPVPKKDVSPRSFQLHLLFDTQLGS